MKIGTLRAERLRAHRLTAPVPTVTAAARHMLAVQSQDFAAGRWALAVRTRGATTLRTVDRAFDRGDLVRAWTMRGTLHTIPARDLRWVLSVTSERQRQQAASRHRDLGIDDEMVAAAARVLEPRLRDGGCTRAEVFALLESIGIDPTGQRGLHLLFTLTIDGLICQGPVVPAPTASGITREQRFVLVDEWIPDSAEPDDPLTELFVRYIDGHGPAGAADFAWWSGLTLGAAREAASRAHGRVVEVEEGLFVAAARARRSAGAAAVHALGAFDEYYISYADRTAVCAADDLAAVGPGKNGMVRPVVLADGVVAGVWRMPPTAARGGVEPIAELFRSGEVDEVELRTALRRHADFLTADVRG